MKFHIFAQIGKLKSSGIYLNLQHEKNLFETKIPVHTFDMYLLFLVGACVDIEKNKYMC